MSLRTGLSNSMALVQWLGDWDWEAADRSFREAIAQDPARDWSYASYGMFLGYMGRFDEAIDSLQKAYSLNPLRSTNSVYLAQVHSWKNESEQAQEWWRKAQELDSVFPDLYQSLVVANLCGSAEHASAIASLEQAVRDRDEDPLILAQLGYCHGRAGDAKKAREMLQRMEAQSGEMYISPLSRAQSWQN